MATNDACLRQACRHLLSAVREEEQLSSRPEEVERLLCAAGAALDPLIAEESGRIQLGALFNTLLRDAPALGDLTSMRLSCSAVARCCMSGMSAPPPTQEPQDDEVQPSSVTLAVLDLEVVQLKLSQGMERWLAELVGHLPSLERISLLMCPGLTLDVLLCILRSLERSPTILSVLIPKKLHDSLLIQQQQKSTVSSRLLSLVQSKTLGASTSVVKDNTTPLSELLHQQVTAGRHNSRTSGGARTNNNDNEEQLPAAAHAPSSSLPQLTSSRSNNSGTASSDAVWAERVFLRCKIPVATVYSHRSRRRLFAYFEALRSTGGKDGRLQAEELEQARRFLQRDSTMQAKYEEEARRLQRKKRGRHERRGGGGRAGGGRDDYSSESDDSDLLDDDNEEVIGLPDALRLVQRNGISMTMALTDLISVEGKLVALRRKGNEALASKVWSAVETLRTESRIKMSFKESERVERARERLEMEHQNAPANENDMVWALDALKSFGFREEDVEVSGGSIGAASSAAGGHQNVVRETIDHLNRSTVTAASGERLQRAVRIVQQSKQEQYRRTEAAGQHVSGTAAPSSLAAMPVADIDRFARQTLRAMFHFDDVDSLTVARAEDVEEELNQLGAGDAEMARWALKALQQIKYGRGVTEDVVEMYRQLQRRGLTK
ncbi:Hypothetical protein, putative [Bodo saltans]|uniref:Uncharacterized protein n=1 Tax=Bodo saltans TaxID=75058 RepID=A0A0S4IXJ6_BODSA|nr:Hypothetical protein, putative [Bodo saltans]|eukprot:CUG40432.1 Hypothetical protein, putative [Bodo saltans]